MPGIWLAGGTAFLLTLPGLPLAFDHFLTEQPVQARAAVNGSGNAGCPVVNFILAGFAAAFSQ